MPSYLGQNFLTDSTYTSFIAQKVAMFADTYKLKQVIEIGPGKGALTKKLITLVNRPLLLLEKDETLMDTLHRNIDAIYVKNPGLDNTVYPQIIMGDALTLETASHLHKINRSAQETIVVGNLPYYITSPLLTKFFGGGNALFPVGVFMVQKEVADKIRTNAEKKSYLWWLLNYQYDVTYLKIVPAKAFTPAPKVQSAIFSLIEKSQKPGFTYQEMVYILDKISMYKRKTLGKSRKMSGLGEATSEHRAYILPENLAGKRLEEIGLEEMARIIEGV